MDCKSCGIFRISTGDEIMKATIFGGGRMGAAISCAMSKMGYSLCVVDRDSKSLDTNIGGLGISNCELKSIHNLKTEVNILSKNKPDVVISALPYHQNETLASFCIDNSIRYCDLGGSVPVSSNINHSARSKADAPVMTDLGLAPGWINILAEQGYQQLDGADEVSMMVGGLPHRQNNNPLNYTVTWSIDGLINEYRDDCEVLINGQIEKVYGMDGLQSVATDNLGELEAFYTSGGSSHTVYTMRDRGVKYCSYKTLRYPGHCKLVKFLIDRCELPEDCLRHIFEKGCADNYWHSVDRRDLVILKTVVKKGDLSWNKEIIVNADKGSLEDPKNFTAMQKATAFPIASVADIMARGLLDRDFGLARHLSYKHIPYTEFNNTLSQLLKV